jgi:hypothetical protein
MNDLERQRKMSLIAKGYPVRIRTTSGGFIVYLPHGSCYFFRHLDRACDWAIREIELANTLRQ